MTPAVSSLILAIALWATLTLLCCAPNSRQASSPKVLTTQHREAIYAALKTKGLPLPSSLEVTDAGFLVATYELQGRVTPGSVKVLAEESVVTIREAMLPFSLVEAYRVTLNGPSPGTGLIRRYGSARFIEGGSVEWEPAS